MFSRDRATRGVRQSPLAKTTGMNPEIGGTKDRLHGPYRVVETHGLVNIGCHQAISVCLATFTSRQQGARMTRIGRLAHAFITDDEGATMIEYALLAVLIAMVVALAALTLGQAISNQFDKVSTCVNTPSAAHCSPA
jgi:Flp pilus assembly pilin Flp